MPQEEVPLYESKGKQYINMQQKKEPVRLPTGHIAHPTIPGLFIEPEKEKAKLKSKKKNKSVFSDYTCFYNFFFLCLIFNFRS